MSRKLLTYYEGSEVSAVNVCNQLSDDNVNELMGRKFNDGDTLP